MSDGSIDTSNLSEAAVKLGRYDEGELLPRDRLPPRPTNPGFTRKAPKQIEIPKHLQRYVTGPATQYCAGNIPRIVRYRNYRKQTGMGPLLTVWFPAGVVFALLGTYVYKRMFYDHWMTEYRNFWFFTSGHSGNHSKYLNAHASQWPIFPRSAEEYEAMCVNPRTADLPEPPLVPWDVPVDTYPYFWSFKSTRM